MTARARLWSPPWSAAWRGLKRATLPYTFLENSSFLAHAATHPVMRVDCENTVVGATVYRVNAVATVVALVATSTFSSSTSFSTR